MVVFCLVSVWLIILLYVYYVKMTRNFGYWKNRGVLFVPPYPIVGSILDMYLLRKSPSQLAEEYYNVYYDEKVFGAFRSSQPILIIKDLDILNRIFMTNFNSFYSRGLKGHTEEPILRNLFFADGDLWRLLRKRLTHAFSTPKLRAMYPLIELVAARLQKKSEEISANKGSKKVDVKDLMSRYSIDLIGSCGFGLNADSIYNDNCEFKSLGERIFRFGFREIVLMILKDNFPQYFKHFKYLPHIETEVNELVKKIQKERNYEPSERNDFIDIMMECKKKGTITCESMEQAESKNQPRKTAKLEFTDEVIAAQAFIFFAAGFETSSIATGSTLHYLAYHPEYQKKVHIEIDNILEKYNNRICYEAVKEMTFLECVFKESVRMLTPVGYLTRECMETFTIPEINVTIDKGVLIIVPVQAIHRDPKYFPEPEQFLPDRFLSNKMGNMDKNPFLLFGAGPRSCIGGRLGQMQSIAGLVAVLSRCTVEPAPESRRHLTVCPVPNIVQNVVGGLPLIFKQRVQTPA